MSFQENLKTSWSQFFYSIVAIPRSIRFFRQHRLWEGFWRYGWVSRLLIFVAVILGLRFVMILWNKVFSTHVNDPLATVMNMGVAMKDFVVEGYSFLFFGSMKYIILILVEVIVFHVCRRTLELLTGKESEADFKSFVKAQTRMIKVAVRSWVLEVIATVILSIIFGIFGWLDFLEPVLIFGIQCYFLGFALVDNYNEQFGLSIKDSAKYTKGYAGIALGIGLVLNILFLIPIIGPIAAPILGAVTVTIVMYELSDLHLVGGRLLQQLQRLEE